MQRSELDKLISQHNSGGCIIDSILNHLLQKDMKEKDMRIH